MDTLTRSESEIYLKIISLQFYYPNKYRKSKSHLSYIRSQDSVLFIRNDLINLFCS